LRRPNVTKFYPIASSLALLAGFADLIRGGITVAPILLVTGWCVLVPAAIWARRERGPTAASKDRLRRRDTPVERRDAWQESRPSYGVAAATALAILVVYLLTLAPSTALWDASEYVAAAYTLGIPHPPGNPLFILIGRVVALLPFGEGVAVRLNVLTAVCSAAAAGLWFLVVEHATAGWLRERWQRRLTGALAAIIGATAFTVWHQSVVSEKVYTVSLLGFALISWLAVRWTDDPDASGADRRLLMIAYLCGLGYAVHMAGLLPLPAVALVVLRYRPRTLLRLPLVAAGAALFVLGASPFLTQPIRAAHAPPINVGEPTGCRHGLAVSCTFSRETLDALLYQLNRKQFNKPPLTERQAPFTAQLGMWWFYFRWQWLRDAHASQPAVQAALATLAFALGILGAWVHYRSARWSFWYTAAFIATLTVLLVWYMNFKYGASQAPELGDAVPREVRDRDYFFLWSFSAWGLWAALGLVAAWHSLAALLSRGAAPARRALVVAAPVLGFAFVPLVANWNAATRRHDTSAVAFAHDLLNSVEPYGVLVTFGDNDTFPLWYAQEVEGIRRDVTVIGAITMLFNTDWYLRMILRRPVYEYDATRGPAVYRDRAWPKPDGPPLHIPIDAVDTLAPDVLIREPVVFEHAGLSATIRPEAIGQISGRVGVVQRSELLMLRIITESWPERPIYFSRTTAGYAEQLGLGPYLLGQGLARKLALPESDSTGGRVRLAGTGWIDLDRSLALWREVFRGPEAIVRRGDWIDRPSISIPFAYLATGFELVEALRSTGRHGEAASLVTTLRAVARATRMDRELEPVWRDLEARDKSAR
ncbi:MAG TPA: DUF2723 domain-containing protein, partial [Gemmatimonadaceae bacterium]